MVPVLWGPPFETFLVLIGGHIKRLSFAAAKCPRGVLSFCVMDGEFGGLHSMLGLVRGGRPACKVGWGGSGRCHMMRGKGEEADNVPCVQG